MHSTNFNIITFVVKELSDDFQNIKFIFEGSCNLLNKRGMSHARVTNDEDDSIFQIIFMPKNF